MMLAAQHAVSAPLPRFRARALPLIAR